ncbi:MFS transporter [Streptomyces sp. NPDC001668]|uniref:MFS transporter n=1 Tax=unclassified Streptomyces TaxID=2593676 RepID=UPI0036894DC9
MPTSAYRDLLRTPSVPWLLATSVIGRLNQGMTGLALLMLTTEHATYAVAGVVSTAGVVGGFIAGPVLSRWADARGRRRVLTVTAVLNAFTMGALVLAPPQPALLTGLSFLCGLCTPPMTASVRATLPALVGSDRRRSVFALEAALQEVIFVLGPPIAALLAAFGGPRLALGVCGALVLVGTLAYARDRNVDAGREPGLRKKDRRVLRVTGVPRVILAGTLLFAALGCQALGVIAMVSGSRVSADAGLVVACGSLGSLCGGLVYGSLPRHRAGLRRLMLYVAAGLALLPLAPGQGLLSVLVFCWGLTLAPAMSGLFDRLSTLTPRESATEAFGWMNSAVAAGNGLGTALSGLLITEFGARASLAVACAAALLAALVCEPWPARTPMSDRSMESVMPYGPSSVLGEVLRNKQAEAVVRKYAPHLDKEIESAQMRYGTLAQVTTMLQGVRTDPAARDALYAELATLEEPDDQPASPRDEEIIPAADYESEDVPSGSARLVAASHGTLWRTFELELHGPAHGNPFTDVTLRAEFRNGDRSVTAHGFYDGEGMYRVRFLPDAEGDWSFRTTSNARSLDSVTGTFPCGPAGPGDHGPVRVHARAHFQHADGTRFLPLGTTLYAWTHQGAELEKQTLATLAGSPFNKVRMCVFPKWFVHNETEPPRYPFAGSVEEGWDFQRPNPAYFQHLEQQIAQLDALGIQADLILLHPYDRWGFSTMSPAEDDRYLRYVVARLAAYPNVWWSLANEYDLLWSKSTDDWHRIAAVIGDHDPHGHLISVHNWVELWDNDADWVTHASIQRTPEGTREWRERWGKPVAVDELGYEGDIEWGWGNLAPQEMVRRCWEGVVRGGYVTHGECFLADDDVLWWAKGGVLKGESTARLEFLRTIMEDIPSDAAGIDPLPSDFDVPVGGVEGRYYLAYCGIMQPRLRTFHLPRGSRFRADIIDTWNMTVTELPDLYEGTCTVSLPGRPYLAIRLRVVEGR